MNRRAMSKLRRIAALALFIPALALAGCGPAAPSADHAPLAGAAIGGPFTLSDKAGKSVHWDDFKGKWRIIYFGYTYCPDACPADVGVMMRGFARFEAAHPAEAAKVQPIFVSIDPGRDTPARVGEFASAFSPRLLGLTGTPEQIATAAKAFAAYYARGKETPGGGYLMDHSRVAFLFDPEGRPIEMLPVDKGAAEGPAAVAAELEKWVR